MNNRIHLSAGLLVLSLLPTAAVAAPDVECEFTEKVTAELRSCEEGPSEEAWGYLYEDEYGELALAKEYREEFTLINPILPEEVEDGGDPEYDGESSGEEGQISKFFQALLDFLTILIALGGNYEDYLQLIGLSGDYDGTFTANGTTATAMLHLEHDSQVEGAMWITSEGLVLDGGNCSDYEIPFGSLLVNATPSAYNEAHGSTTRSVSVLGITSGTVDVTFDMYLSTVDHETLFGHIFIDAPWPCRDQTIQGQFTRRPLF